MDPELLALLERLQNDPASLSDEELAQLNNGLRDVLATVNREKPSSDELVTVAAAVESLESVEAELATRSEAEETRAAELASLLERVAPVEAVTTTETGEGETAVVVEVAGPEGEGETGESEGEGEPEALAAAGARTRQLRLPPLDVLARRRPASARPTRTQTEDQEPSRAVLTAAADLPGVSAGQIIDISTFASSSMDRFKSLRMVEDPRSDGEKVYFGRITAPEYPESRQLTGTESIDRKRVLDVVGTPALTASGGICGPVAVDYSVLTVATADRPVKAALAAFGAARGGLRYILPHTLAQVTADGPASIWTQTTDASPGGSTKPHATFLCQTVLEAYVDAVTSIVQFGNFQARYFPEQIEQYMETVDAVHSRLAEATLLAAIAAGSSVMTYGAAEVGATRDFLAAIDRSSAQFRYINRMAPDAPLRLLYPAWLNNMFRADLARNLPGDSGGQSERLAVSNPEIASWLAVRNINASAILDSVTNGNGYGAPTGGSASPLQGFVGPPAANHSGQLPPWPSRTQCWLFHEGAWVFLDGGELNLGMVRDSTLNKTNDFQMFTETFEKAIFRGHSSFQLDMTIAPTGATIGTVAASSETLGS